MTLSVEQQILIEQRIANDRKSTLVAYILWFFFYGLAAHRFYLGYIRSAIAMLTITALGFILTLGGTIMLNVPRNADFYSLGFTLFLIGFILLGIILVWAILDAFLIPGMIREQKKQLRQHLTSYYKKQQQ